MPPRTLGAKWGAISGRYRATWSLLRCSIPGCLAGSKLRPATSADTEDLVRIEVRVQRRGGLAAELAEAYQETCGDGASSAQP